jgi:threonine synthase
MKDSQYTIDYHRDELFTEAEKLQLTAVDQVRHAALRKPPIVLEADATLVLRTLESYMNHPQPA